MNLPLTGRQAVRALAAGLLDAILPPLCLICDRPLAATGLLCAACWEDIDFVAPPHCRVCGYPFEFDLGEETLCGACAGSLPPYDRCRAVMRYGETARRLLLGFKHADRTEGAASLGQWMARAGHELRSGTDIIVPVPLHWRRLLRRRFNQAALLAWALAEAWRDPPFMGDENPPTCCPDLLLRVRATPSQGHLSLAQRRQNVAGALKLNPKRRQLLQGRRVLLVDDVMTTGATVEACSRVLKRSGAVEVQVLVLARVMRPGGA